MDSGRGSGGGADAGGGAGRGVNAGGEGVAAAVLEARLCCRAGTACGSSMVDEAMSSRRAVAASSLSLMFSVSSAMLRGRLWNARPVCKGIRVDIPLNQRGQVMHVVGCHFGKCHVWSLPTRRFVGRSVG